MRSTVLKSGGEEQQDDLRQLAQEIVSRISEQDPSRSKELLATFVAELFLSATRLEQQEVRCQNQKERILAAKKHGVRFGRQRLALPEGFETMARLWKEGGVSAGNAAAELGMSRDTFLRRAREYCETSPQNKQPDSTAALEKGVDQDAGKTQGAAQRRKRNPIHHHQSPALS